MDLTSVDRVKALSDQFPGTGSDARLAVLVSAVSRSIEETCGREFGYVARTPIFDLKPGQSRFPLKAYPAIALTDVRYDPTGVFGIDTVLDNTDNGRYVVDTELGSIVFKAPWAIDLPKSLKVSYTGGIATGATNGEGVAVAVPDVALAAAKQVLWEFKRTQATGYASEALRGGSVSYDFAGETRGLLREVFDAIRPYMTQLARY